MTILRVPGYREGDDLSAEPYNYFVYDTETKEGSYECNPYFVSAPTSTADMARWKVEQLERDLASARAYLAELTDDA